MTGAESTPLLHVPARDIPVPSSVSPEARAVLSVGSTQSGGYPDVTDLEAWRAMIKAQDEMLLPMMLDRASHHDVEVEDTEVDGVRVHVITPRGVADDDRRVFLDI